MGGTKVTSSGTTITLGEPGGLINKFRNGTFDVWQRGTSALTASTGGAYTADGWIVKQTGAAFTCAQASGPTTSVGGDYAFGDPVIRLPTEMYQRMRDGERILMWYATDGVTLHVQTEEEAWDMEFDQPDGMDAIID